MTPPDAPLSPTTPTTVTPAAAPAVPATSDPAAATPVQPVVVARPSGGNRWVNILLGAAAVLAIGGVAFAAGRATAPADALGAFPDEGFITNGPRGSFDPAAGPQVRPGGPRFQGAGGPSIQGTVTDIDADSMTIQSAGGDELTIALDDETTYHEATDADASAVQVGDEVAVEADGGTISIGGDGSQTDQDADGLTANDVTVRR